MKKIVLFLLCFVLLFQTTAVLANIDNNTQHNNSITKNDKNNTINPEWVPFCPNSPDGYHSMWPSPGGYNILYWIENGKTMSSKYTLWTCKYCGASLYESTGYDVWAYESDIYKEVLHYNVALGYYYDIWINPRYGALPGSEEGYIYHLYWFYVNSHVNLVCLMMKFEGRLLFAVMMKAKLYFLIILTVLSFFFVSCSDVKLDRYCFNKSSDPILLYVDNGKIILNDGDNVVLEREGKLYKIPNISYDFRKDDVVFLPSCDGNYAIIGNIDNPYVVNLNDGSKTEIDKDIILYTTKYYPWSADNKFLTLAEGNTIKIVDLRTLKTNTKNLDVEAQNAICIGSLLYFESKGKIYKIANDSQPQFITNGYLLSVDDKYNIYLYRNLNMKETKIYKVDKHGSEKEIAYIDEPVIYNRIYGNLFIAMTKGDKGVGYADYELINLKTSKHITIKNGSGNIDVFPVLSRNGDISIKFVSSDYTELIDTRDGTSKILKNFIPYTDSDRKFSIDIYRNIPLDLNEIVQIKKDENGFSIVLVDADNKKNKTIADFKYW